MTSRNDSSKAPHDGSLPKATQSKRHTSRVRPLFVVVHRYVGLIMAAFLVLAGVTGSVIAFFADLDAALNPELFVAEPPIAGQAPLDPFTLREKLQEQLPKAHQLHGVILNIQKDRTVNYWVDEREVFVDPYTGEVRGSRKFGDLREGRKTFLTFIYRLHYSLSLGDVGVWIFGIVALLWTIDCFVGAYLTFPSVAAEEVAAGRRSWFVRWLPAWLLKTNKLFSLVFTWHRASGLWVWGMLFVFAWSAVALNLGDQVYSPLMNVLFKKEEEVWDRLPKLEPPRDKPKLSLREAHDVGRRLMSMQAEQRHFEVFGEQWLDYEPDHGTYNYTVESSLDISERLAETTLFLDGDTGTLLGFSAPTGQNTNSTITSWLIALHFGAVREGGLVYRALVCVMGFVVALLSVSGVWIWWRKWRGRKSNRERQEQRRQKLVPDG